MRSTLQWEITPQSSSRIDANELWQYRHLLFSLVKRDFLLVNQQTILGPLWILFQPLLTLFVYVLIFSRLVGIPTGNLPPVIFYYSGIILWNLFGDSFNGAAGTIKDNQQIFSKIYLPRIIFPIAVAVTQLLRFGVQFCLLIILALFYSFQSDFSISFNGQLLFFPLSVSLICVFGIALGLIASIVAARYRDMFNIISILIRLLMFATPVIYPLHHVSSDLRWILEINPLTSFFELFRYSLFNDGSFSMPTLIMVSVATVLLLITAVKTFMKRSNHLLDTI